MKIMIRKIFSTESWPYSTQLFPRSDIHEYLNGLALERIRNGEDEITVAMETEKIREHLIRKVAFWNLLVSIGPRLGFRPPIDQDVTIINIACGKGEDCGPLQSYFGGENFGYPSTRARVFGIDIHPVSLIAATQDHAKIPQIQFRFGDARNLSAIADLPVSADVVVMRHQAILYGDEGKEVWVDILSEVKRKFGSSALFLLTSYTKDEHELLEAEMSNLGYAIRLSECNPESVEIAHLKAIDHFVLAATG